MHSYIILYNNYGCSSKNIKLVELKYFKLNLFNKTPNSFESILYQHSAYVYKKKYLTAHWPELITDQLSIIDTHRWEWPDKKNLENVFNKI